MNKSDSKETDGNDEQGGSAGQGTTRQTVPHAPGGPGWVSEHSKILWIVGIVLVISGFAIYMIIDN